MKRKTATKRSGALAEHALDVCEETLRGMDRSGGDRYGMPECPWCRRGPDGEDHDTDCGLVLAREAIAAARSGKESGR